MDMLFIEKTVTDILTKCRMSGIVIGSYQLMADLEKVYDMLRGGESVSDERIAQVMSSLQEEPMTMCVQPPAKTEKVEPSIERDEDNYSHLKAPLLALGYMFNYNPKGTRKFVAVTPSGTTAKMSTEEATVSFTNRAKITSEKSLHGLLSLSCYDVRKVYATVVSGSTVGIRRRGQIDGICVVWGIDPPKTNIEGYDRYAKQISEPKVLEGAHNKEKIPGNHAANVTGEGPMTVSLAGPLEFLGYTCSYRPNAKRKYVVVKPCGHTVTLLNKEQVLGFTITAKISNEKAIDQVIKMNARYLKQFYRTTASVSDAKGLSRKYKVDHICDIWGIPRLDAGTRGYETSHQYEGSPRAQWEKNKHGKSKV